MTSIRVYLFVLVSAVLAAAAWAIYNAHQADAAALAGLSVQRERDALLAKLSAAKDALKQAEKDRARQKAATQSLGKEKASAKTTAKKKSAVNPEIDERFEKETAFAALFLAFRRATFRENYGPLFAQLRLTPEQQETFLGLALRRVEQEMDLVAESRNKGLNPQSEARALQENWETFNHGVQDLLGAQYPQFTEFERTSNLRAMIAGMAGGAVTVLNEPFTAQQAEQLVQAIANGSASYRQGGLAGGDRDWQMIDDRAREILSPTQFDYFRTLEPPLPSGGRYQADLYQAAATARTADLMSKGAKPLSP